MIIIYVDNNSIPWNPDVNFLKEVEQVSLKNTEKKKLILPKFYIYIYTPTHTISTAAKSR